jgi:UDP-4-amino-4,6-dideoxy-N-acetyl-beta-L-altrosamine transaminase
MPLPFRRAQAARPTAPFLPYGRQLIEEDDIAAVAEALRSDYLTTGPTVTAFEEALARTVGARHAVACNIGTAALYLASRAIGIGLGSTVIVPAITFLATATGPHLAGAEIIFADVDPETGLMRAEDLEAALGRAPDKRADAIFPVHYAGQSCDMAAIASIARARSMRVVEDAAHALGSAWLEKDGSVIPVGANKNADLTIFSFHPVKTIAMGEGGAVTANDAALTRRLRQLRNHGITRESSEFLRAQAGVNAKGEAHPWYYELHTPSFNFRVPDINCALGLSQLRKLARFVAHRQMLVTAYDELLKPLGNLVRPIARHPSAVNAWHIYPVRIDFAAAKIERSDLVRKLAGDNIGTQVHYVPVHRQPYFAARHGGLALPGAETYYAKTLSLPLHAAMGVKDVERVADALKRHLGA